jgi:hypothetical protein
VALTLAEKQERYRERHLGLHGTKERIQFFRHEIVELDAEQLCLLRQSPRAAA